MVIIYGNVGIYEDPTTNARIVNGNVVPDLKHKRTLVVKNTDRNEVNSLELDLNESSLTYVGRLEENGVFVKYADTYEEVEVNDLTEQNIVLNKLIRNAKESKEG